MRIRSVVGATLLVLVIAACTAPQETTPPPAETTAAHSQASTPVKQSPYPASPMGDVVDDLHGTKVKDPYRWLENPDSPETQKWVGEQNALTFGWLGKVATREAMKKRLTELWNYERFSPPFVEGKGKNRRTYYWKNDGLQNQAVLFVEDAPGKARVLLDPNALSKDGTVALGGMQINDEGTMMAYALSTGGSDWMEWHVKDIATGPDTSDLVKWSKFSGASWTPDGKGFFY